MPKAELSREVNSLDGLRPSPVKASLRQSTTVSPVHVGPRPVTEIVSGVIRAQTQKAAAIDMQIDPAQLSRQLESGHLTIGRLDALSPEALARIGKELHERFAPLADPKEHARRKCDELQAIVNELRQFIEGA
jgi:hypothetical protein